MEKYLSVKASAGSGKTFALTVRYISLLLHNANPSQILALTFTNKAASEMSQRIFNTLQNLGNDKAYLEAITKQTGLSVEQILSKKENILKKFIQAELSIYTIDKFINKILREFSGYVNISDDFAIQNSDQDLLIYKYLKSLQYEEFNQLIDFAYLQEKKLQSIMGVFQQLQEKNELYFVNDAIQTKHLFWLQEVILENAYKIKEYIQNFDGMSQSGLNAVDFQSVAQLLEKGKTWLGKDTLGEYTYFKKSKPDHLQEVFETLKIDIIKYFKVSEQLILNNLFSIYNAYEKFILEYNKQKNKLTFNEITNLVYKLFEKTLNNNNEFLYFRLDTKYNHLLIDEFQDTSILQYKILEPIIAEIVSGKTQDFKTFFYVGDTKQSIYRFRGGNAQLFDYVRKKFPQIVLEELDVNYRSSQNVVEFVNTVFEGLNSYDYSHQKVNSNILGYVSIEPFNNEANEVLPHLAKHLKQLFQNGIDENNICILTFTNQDVFNIYNYLKQVFPQVKINTEMTSKLIFQKNVAALINAVKYLYFNENIYLENFNSLLGFPMKTPLLSIKDIAYEPLQKVLKQIGQHYKIVDENVLKFFEIVNEYECVIDFVYQIDNNDATMVNKEKSGLQIMTIFKSKGLEFDTVFLIDKLTNPASDKNSLIFDYETIRLEHIYYKMKERENIDKEYANAMQKEKTLNELDQLNVMYVALTRAKNNMIILKKEEKSIFDSMGEMFYKNSYGKLHIEERSNNAIQKQTTLEYQSLNLGYQEKNSAPEENDEKNLFAQYFGIATHLCLEMMKEFTLESLHKALPIAKKRFDYILDEKVFEDIEQRITSLIDNNEFQELVGNGKLYKEQPFIYENELKIIDLMVVKENEIIIIDYKTTQEMHSSHLMQVNQYKKGISAIFDDCTIQTYIIYLKKDYVKIVR